MIKSVDKTFNFFVFKYQEGYETAEFHADIKSGENVEKNVCKKIYTPNNFMISNNGKTANFLTNLLMAFFKVTFWQFFNSFEINVKLTFFDAMTKV
jgi:hypothetical protein